MKSLIIFYSLEGHTRFIAEAIMSLTNADMFDLKTHKQYPLNFAKYISGGKDVIFKKKPSLKTDLPDVQAYDRIYLGTPIWAGMYTPPILSVLTNCSFAHKEVALFATFDGGGASKCFQKIRKHLTNAKIIGQIEFEKPSAKDKVLIVSHLKDWLHDLDA